MEPTQQPVNEGHSTSEFKIGSGLVIGAFILSFLGVEVRILAYILSAIAGVYFFSRAGAKRGRFGCMHRKRTELILYSAVFLVVSVWKVRHQLSWTHWYGCQTVLYCLYAVARGHVKTMPTTVRATIIR